MVLFPLLLQRLRGTGRQPVVWLTNMRELHTISHSKKHEYHYKYICKETEVKVKKVEASFERNAWSMAIHASFIPCRKPWYEEHLRWLLHQQETQNILALAMYKMLRPLLMSSIKSLILRNLYLPNNTCEHTTRENKWSYGTDAFCLFLHGVLHGPHFPGRHGDSYSMTKTSITAYFPAIISEYHYANDHKKLWYVNLSLIQFFQAQYDLPY